ncbi:sensor histidine kinase [uncultured Bifidobacterium sp.]|uniref:sensor histidine kinase n=1 Tax=uncultured Bifidobacterium sp. TaxID=165187 RepID=UPI0037DD8DD0
MTPDSAAPPASAPKSGAKPARVHRPNRVTAFVVRRLDRVPLGVKLVAVTMILLIVGMVGVSFSIRQLVGSYLLGKTDTQLVQQAELVYNNVALLSSKDGSQSTAGPTDYFLQVRDTSGRILATPLVPVLKGGVVSMPTLPSNGSTDDVQLGKPFTTQSTVSSGSSSSADHATLQAARAPWRVLALQWMDKSSDGTSEVGGVVYIGLSLSDQIDTVGTLTRYTAMVGIAIMLLGVVIATLLIQRTLAPLKRIEKTAAKIAAGDLSQRVPSAPENTEVGSLSASLNAMLARIERSFHEQEETTEKMKRFVSDASHELRTPLAAIHGYAELYTMQRGMPGALDRADASIAHIEASSSRMTVLVEDLLSLARLDEGRGIDVRQTVNLTSLVRDAVDDLHALDPGRGIRAGRPTLGRSDPSSPSHLVAEDGPLPEVALPGDPSRIRQVITNIVGNIHRYTPTDSRVEVLLGTMSAALPPQELSALPPTEGSLRGFLDAVEVGQSVGGGTTYAVLRFVDHGPGVPAESRGQIFERFYTADPSRAREKGGTGLGMAIALSVVRAHRGFIVATETEGGGLTLTVILPVASPVAVMEDDGNDRSESRKPKGPRRPRGGVWGMRRGLDAGREETMDAGTRIPDRPDSRSDPDGPASREAAPAENGEREVPAASRGADGRSSDGTVG